MNTLFPRVMEKVARVFGSWAPDGDVLAERAIPYNVRRRKLETHYRRKAGEQPSSRKSTIGGGAALGALLGTAGAASFRRKGRGIGALEALLVGGGAGGALGAAAGGVARQIDKGRIADARSRLQRGPGHIDDDMMRRVKHFRRAQAVKRTLDAVAPAAIEQHGRTQRTKLQLADNAAARKSRDARDETTRRASLLSSLKGHTGAESAARGHFGKSLGELTARELAVIQGSLR